MSAATWARTAHRHPAAAARTTAGGNANGADRSTTLPTEHTNIYADIGPGHLAARIAGDPARVYVPDSLSNTVSVIDPTTRKVIDTFPTSDEPQHVVPSFDLKTLWVLDDAGNDVIPIDPATGRPGAPIPVTDPYNLYFSPDGASAIVVAEAHSRLDFRDPHTMALTGSLEVPGCAGINHADYDASGSYMIVTCEYAGRLAKIDIVHRRVLGLLDLSAHPVRGQPMPAPSVMPDGMSASLMPQDVRTGPDGRHFYVADMRAGGVFVVDGDTFKVTRFIATGVGAHGITPSRDGTLFYVANRGSDQINGPPHGPGSVSVIDPATNVVKATWIVPGGGSPDMGNLNAAGTELWLSGRFDREVYVFDTVHGVLAARIPVGKGPHGLTVWPQPGRYSLGHTGNMR
ncbi:MAG: YncE family protein [Pseudonocardia sp.]|nr:YncE family protein [Pseudonocardia sp.]